jgi:hypothetical protein
MLYKRRAELSQIVWKPLIRKAFPSRHADCFAVHPRANRRRGKSGPEVAMKRSSKWIGTLSGSVAVVAAISLGAGEAGASPTVYSNLTVNGAMATSSRPNSEVESADDFILGQTTSIDHATFIGLLPSNLSLGAITQVRLEIYRVFPLDSDTTRPIVQVPTRANSPSDVAFAERDSLLSELTFSASILNPTFTAANSVAPGGIHPAPGFHTGGNGAVTGEEVQFEVDLATPFLLPADHYFFVPQVQLVNGDGDFYWLSATRPVAITPDLQEWIRDDNLDPDWLRVGTDIVGGTNAPTFNAAFALNGAAVVSEPETVLLIGLAGLASLVAR